MKPLLKPTQFTLALFAVYLILLYWIIVLKFNITAYHDRIERNINLIPFREALLYQSKMDLNEILLNVFIFIPLGLYVGILGEKWGFGKKVIQFFSISFFFELCQYILKVGAFDVTDLITNTAGGLLGLLIYAGLERVFESRIKTQKFINIICLIGTVLIFSFLIFLKINNLWIFRMQLL